MRVRAIMASGVTDLLRSLQEIAELADTYAKENQQVPN